MLISGKHFTALILAASVAIAALSSAPDNQRVHAAATPAPVDEAEVVEEDMHEFMEYVFQPTYRRLKAAMAEKPADRSGWKAIKSDALILAESCNLLFARTPEDNGSDWNHHAAASRKDGAALYRSARDQNFEKASTAYKSMLENCNACHRQFEDGRHILSP